MTLAPGFAAAKFAAKVVKVAFRDDAANTTIVPVTPFGLDPLFDELQPARPTAITVVAITMVERRRFMNPSAGESHRCSGRGIRCSTRCRQFHDNVGRFDRSDRENAGLKAQLVGCLAAHQGHDAMPAT